MNLQKILFKLLKFNHLFDELSFYFTNKLQVGTHKVFRSKVPPEVINHFGEQDDYYTSFNNPLENALEVTKKIKFAKVEDSSNVAFSSHLVKQFYNYQINNHFRAKGYTVKPNFIHDNQVWIPSPDKKHPNYNIYDKYCLKVQFGKIVPNFPELVISYEGTSKIFKQSVEELWEEIPTTAYTWVINNNNLFRFSEHPELVDEYKNTFPIWNIDIRTAIKEKPETPDFGNKYQKYYDKIQNFFSRHLCNESFQNVISINCDTFIPVEDKLIGQVKKESNKLLFANKSGHISPISGMNSHGPIEGCSNPNVAFFFIFHENDEERVLKMHDYLKGSTGSFKGLKHYAKVPYQASREHAIKFKSKTNPLPDISRELQGKLFRDDVTYIALYISPIDKYVSDKEQRKQYYRIKEALLDYGITSQVLDAEKLDKPAGEYRYSLPNIAVAILAKLGGTPWKLDTKLKNELIIGVGAFKNSDNNITYIGSAFSFMNNGKFNRFDCFRKSEYKDLAGSILKAVKDYSSINDPSRLIIHYYKEMSSEESKPIEQGLKLLNLRIPVFIVTINKTESRDIIAFDDQWVQKMPLSGTYIRLGFNKFLLFNNTRYSDSTLKNHEGFPFPVKLTIKCNEHELEKDYTIIQELINQVYQFSRLYWKSVSQQNLPVTIKYPELVAEMFPHFKNNEIPEFGKDNLWFL